MSNRAGRSSRTSSTASADLGPWRSHGWMVGAASVFDLFGVTLATESRKVPAQLRRPWLLTVAQAQLIMFAAVMAGTAGAVAQVVLTGEAWLSALLMGLTAVPVTCQVVLARRARRS